MAYSKFYDFFFSKSSRLFHMENECSQFSVRTRKFFILRRDYVKDLGVHIGCKCCFHHQVDFLFSHPLKFLGIITITISFPTLDSVLIVCSAFVKSELKYASVA